MDTFHTIFIRSCSVGYEETKRKKKKLFFLPLGSLSLSLSTLFIVQRYFWIPPFRGPKYPLKTKNLHPFFFFLAHAYLPPWVPLKMCIIPTLPDPAAEVCVLSHHRSHVF